MVWHLPLVEGQMRFLAIASLAAVTALALVAPAHALVVVGQDYFSAATTRTVTFEGLSGVPVLDNQYSYLGVDFNGSMISHELGFPATGVNATWGIRSAEPGNVLDGSGYRLMPDVSFTVPVFGFGFWLTDTLGQMFTVTAYGNSGSALGSYTLVGPIGSGPGAPEAPVFVGLASVSPVASFTLRAFDAVNGVPGSCCTLSFEIDDLIFRVPSIHVPIAGTPALVFLGLLLIAAGCGRSSRYKVGPLR